MGRRSSPTVESVVDRMPGVPTVDLCRCVLSGIWVDSINACGVSGQAIHAHALESLVCRVLKGECDE